MSTENLEKNLSAMDAAQLRETILDLCRNDGKIRARVSEDVENRLRPKGRANNNLTPQRNGAPPISKYSRELRSNSPSLFSRLPMKTCRVQAFRNGTDSSGVAIAAKTLDGLLVDATEKLKLENHAQRIYDESGKRLTDLDSLKTDATVYVSMGEPWIDPVAPRGRTIARIPANHRLISTPKIRLQAKRNGDASDDHAIVVAAKPGAHSVEQTLDMLLEECTEKLEMPSAAKRLFDETGTEITTTADLKMNQVVYATNGEPFRDPTNAMPTVGVRAIAANHRLLSQPAKSIMVLKNGAKPLVPHLRDGPVLQLGVSAVGNTLEKLLENCTVRLELNSAARKLYTAEGKLVEEFDDINRGQLYYVSCGEAFIDPDEPLALASNSIVALPSTSRLATKQKTRVLAFKNGEIDGAVRIVISKPTIVLEECTRKLKLTTGARRLYTEEGKEIKEENYGELENEQRVYVSCGEPFRVPGKFRKPESHVLPIPEDSGLLSTGKVRVICRRNGWPDSRGRTIVGGSIQQLLEEATAALSLTAPAKKLYDDRGRRLTDMSHFRKDMDVFVSIGGAYRAGSPTKTSPKRRRRADTPADSYDGGKSSEDEAPATTTATVSASGSASAPKGLASSVSITASTASRKASPSGR